MKAGILSIGSYVPTKLIKNKDLEDTLDTNDEWITERTGIKQRYIAMENEETSDMGTKAAEIAILKSKLKKEELDLIIVATSTPDYCGYPSTACIIQRKLGIENIPCFDITAACTGLIFAVTTAKAYIESGKYKNILVIGAEKNSKILDWSDRNTAILFGDGASALIISKDSNNKILDYELYSDGLGSDLLKVDKYIKMDGKKVFKFATTQGEIVVEKLLKNNGIENDEVACFIPHQANKRIIDFLSKRLKVENKKMYFNGYKYANTSSASVGLALDEFIEGKPLNSGDKIVLFAFGAGLAVGAILTEYRSS